MVHAEGFHPLPLSGLNDSPKLVTTQRRANLTDAALPLMTDLSHSPCVMADHLDGVEPTLHTMVSARVHMAFVTDVQDRVIGLITTHDLQGERPLQRAMADHVHFEDLSLEQLMTPVNQWPAVSSAALAHARVGDIVATLEEQSLRYLLVVDHEGGEPVLRGLFSARQLEASLGRDIAADLHSRSFAELEATIGH
jgi:CBS domain containing-hemolysin-like protein